VEALALTKAVRAGYNLRWVDKRQAVTKQALDLDVIEAVLCNVVLSSSLLRAFWEQRHWFAIRKVGLSIGCVRRREAHDRGVELATDRRRRVQPRLQAGRSQGAALRLPAVLLTICPP
jgi:hypothetical protein